MLKPGWKRFAVRCFDAITAFFKKKQSRFLPQSGQKALVIRNDHLGDIAMAYSAIRALAESYPQVSIDFLTSQEGARIFQNARFLNRIIPWKKNWFSRNASFYEKLKSAWEICQLLKQESYVAAIDFRGDIRNILLAKFSGIQNIISYPVTGGSHFLSYAGTYDFNLHQTDLNYRLLEGLGLRLSWRSFMIETTPDDQQEITQILKKIKSVLSEPLFLVHPGAGVAQKKWPEKRYREIIETFLTSYPQYSVGILGTIEEKRQSLELGFASPRVTDLRGQIPLELLPALFGRASLFLGNDSGPAHIAAAQNIPSLVLFSGTNRPEIWSPRGNNTHIISCRQNEPMSTISVDRVWSDIRSLMKDKR